jgi:Calpain family cysteine protease
MERTIAMVAETQLEAPQSSYRAQAQPHLDSFQKELNEASKHPNEFNNIVSNMKSEVGGHAGSRPDKPGTVTELNFGSHDIYQSDSSPALTQPALGRTSEAGKVTSESPENITKETEKPTNNKSGDGKALTAAEFVDTTKNLFGKLDKDHDGTLTKAEVAKAMEDPSIKGNDAQALAALYNNFDRLSRMHGSIKIGDLDRFTNLLNQSKKKENTDAGKNFETVTKMLENHPNLFGAKGDHLLSLDKLNDALKDSKYSAEDKEGLKYLKDNYAELSEGKSGVGLVGVVHKACDLEAVEKLPGDLDDIAKQRNPDASLDLYNPKELHPINPDAVQQGEVGDCYFLAAVAAVAKTNPDAIKNMIKDNSDGTYTVTFPGDAGHHQLKVNKPTEAEEALYNGGSKYGTWASVLEKAYGQLGKIHKDLGDDTTPAMGIKDGGWSAQPLYVLTGHVANEKAVQNTSEKEMLAVLQDAFKNNKAVTVGSTDQKTGQVVPAGYDEHHEFTFMGLEKNANGGWDVILRNPWGTGTENTNNGVFKVPLKQLMDKDLFDSVTVDQ